MLCGSGEAEPQSEVTAQLAQEIYNANLLEQLITDLAKIDFEVCLFLPLLWSCLYIVILNKAKQKRKRVQAEPSMSLEYI